MALYRCLRSVGFQVVMINVTIDRNLAHCGLVFWGANLSTLPLRLTDIDTGQVVGKVIPPDEAIGLSAHIWMHDSRDSLEFEVIPP